MANDDDKQQHGDSTSKSSTQVTGVSTETEQARSEVSTEQAQPETTSSQSESRQPSRRALLKAGVIGGGIVAAVGGAVLGAQDIVLPRLQVQGLSGGQLREYWVQADAFHHNMIPTGYDGMMGMHYQPNQSSFWAIGYRAFTPGWGQPLSGNDEIGTNTGIPGPVFRGAVGDTIRVHFRNNDTHYRYPHSIHPHGVFYTPQNDGGWYALNPEPGSSIEVGQSYTYEWQVHPNSVGTWVYHDHARPSDPDGLMEFSAELGLIGFLALTDASTKSVDKEFFTFLHDVYQDDIPGISQDYDCFNGCSYVGNTPTLTAKVGQTIRWHVGALGKEFHVFHVHGHRWLSGGQYTDTVHLGPSIATSFEFVEDNPGKWLYHCHVTDHMMGGMTGLYVVTT
jgi:manganese oxidase